MGLFEVGGTYPPKDHLKRIKRYRENTLLVKGEHADVLRKVADKNDFAYLVVNLPQLLCKKYADFLFSEEPTFSAGKDDKSEEQKALERLIADNSLQKKNFKSAFSNSYKGDSFYKVRWAQTYNGLENEKDDPFKVIIDVQNPEIVFPETVPGDYNTIYGYNIAYPVSTKINGKDYWKLIVEAHYPNRIENSRYEMTPSKTYKGKILEWTIDSKLALPINIPAVYKTGVKRPLVEHVPNFQDDGSWEGIDDISDLKSQFSIINNRVSQLQNVLNKHADPALIVPSGVLVEDPITGELTFNISRDKVFEVGEKGNILPQYVTWDAKVDAVFKDIEMAINHLLMLAEIPPVALGLVDSGTSGSSGLSIKYRMNSLLSKVKRKMQYYNEGLRNVLVLAQELEHSKVNKRKLKYEVTVPRIKFKDGLPNDQKEDALVSQILTGGQPIFSVKTTLMDKYGYTEEQADIEIQRIIDEENKRYSLSPSSITTTTNSTQGISQPEDNQNPDRKGFDE